MRDLAVRSQSDHRRPLASAAVRYRIEVAHTRSISTILWLLTTSWLAACGRFEFDPIKLGAPGGTPDASADAPPDDARPGDAPPGNLPAPVLEVVAMRALDTLCGSDPNDTPAQIEVSNSGTADLVITSATVPAASRFKVTQVPSRIAPGATEKITVIPPMAVVGTDRASTTFEDTLALRTSAGDRDIALVATVVGANIDLEMPAGATELLFAASSGCPGPQTVVVRNTGNAAGATVAAYGSSDAPTFGLGGFSGGSIPAGATRTTTLRALTSGECAASGVFAYDAPPGPSNLCTTTTLQVTLDITSGSSCFCS